MCAVILNTRLGKSVNSFNSLSMNQQESLRNQFPKIILFRDLSNLFTSASNSKQMLSHNDVVCLPFIMVPVDRDSMFGYSSHSFATVVVIVTRIVLPCHCKISVPH